MIFNLVMIYIYQQSIDNIQQSKLRAVCEMTVGLKHNLLKNKIALKDRPRLADCVYCATGRQQGASTSWSGEAVCLIGVRPHKPRDSATSPIQETQSDKCT